MIDQNYYFLICVKSVWSVFGQIQALYNVKHRGLAIGAAYYNSLWFWVKLCMLIHPNIFDKQSYFGIRQVGYANLSYFKF